MLGAIKALWTLGTHASGAVSVLLLREIADQLKAIRDLLDDASVAPGAWEPAAATEAGPAPGRAAPAGAGPLDVRLFRTAAAGIDYWMDDAPCTRPAYWAVIRDALMSVSNDIKAARDAADLRT